MHVTCGFIQWPWVWKISIIGAWKGPNEVSAPMAPVCRTESVVHNATMAVILEGIVLSLVIPGSLGQTDMPSHQLLLRSFTCFFLHPWKSWKFQVPSPQILHKCHAFGSATLARHISLHKKAMMLTLDAWPCLPFSSQTSRSGPMRDIFGMGGYQHGVTLVSPQCDWQIY